jgi:hypothetical protein
MKSHDHLAGSVAALELLHHLIAQADEKSGDWMFLIKLHSQIQMDQKTLEDLISDLGMEQSPVRKAASWVVEKAGRLKLGHSESGGMDYFQALEGLALGITGKGALWKALQEVSGADARLEKYDFAALKKRADEQWAGVEARRLETARKVFQGEPVAQTR